MRTYVMCILLHLTLLLSVHLNKGDEYNSRNLTVKEMTNKIVDIFNVNHEQGRIKELKIKMDKINNYVLDNELFAKLLVNVTSETELNQTNFYQALNENDQFRFLTTNDSQNLYLQLKSRMNHDDVMKILAIRGEKGKLMKSARRMIKNIIPKGDDERKVNDVVDKIIGEVPKDDHKIQANESIYWDPQGELEDLKEYHDAKRNGRRVFRGVRTNIREWPFMASIHITGRFWCGGVIYWQDLVITSASCLQLLYNNRFFRENPRVVHVRIGSNHSRVGGEMIDVQEIYFHPSYDPKTLQANLAVLRLQRHLRFTYHRIPKILDISDQPTSIPPTSDILILGWGVAKMSQKLSFEPIFLQKKYLPVYPNSFCKEVYGSKFITETMFCAGTITTGEGACDHDAGGPAVLAGRLVGVISFGPATCGFVNAPTVFTLVGAFSDWIESVNESMPQYYRYKHPTSLSTKSIISDFFHTWVPSNTKHPPESVVEPVQDTTAPFHERSETSVPTTTSEKPETTEKAEALLEAPETPKEHETPNDLETPKDHETPKDQENPKEIEIPKDIETPNDIETPIVPETPEPAEETPEPEAPPESALRIDASDGEWSIENR